MTTSIMHLNTPVPFTPTQYDLSFWIIGLPRRYSPSSSMDTQVVELLGRNRLTSELLRAGLEVAIPVRDRGVDLIAYINIGERLDAFVSCPIQMKAATKASFNLARKYERILNLILAYVWHVDDASRAVSYALTYAEAFAIGEQMGWTRTPSWEKGVYSTSRPSARLRELLEPYRMTSRKWRDKLTAVIARPPSSPGYLGGPVSHTEQNT